MSEATQRTISSSVTVEGIGVHTGAPAKVTFRPADPDSGIRFRRMDLPGKPVVPADLDHVTGSELGITLGVGEARVLTVEHVMAPLAALGVVNVLIELDGPEVPIRDGSFRDYLEALTEARPVDQEAPAAVIALSGPVSFVDGEQAYVATPADALRVSATIVFEHEAIGRQHASFPVDADTFRTELAPARTFGFAADADALRARGLALGASLDNTVVLDEAGVMNDALRFPDEFLRHKVGDLVGDLALAGARIEAHIVAERPSHAGNVALARALAAHARHARRRPALDTARIMEFLPHRYPMLLVDRITEYEKGKRVVGIKNVTINEPFFQGHFPGHPVMPGVLIIEAMAQVGGVLLLDEVPDPENKVVYFMTADKVKWRKPVTPGDTIVFELELMQFRRQVCKLRGKGFVDGDLVAEAELMARVMDR